MKKIILVFVIIFLIISTVLTKNSSKKLENRIYITKENISILKTKHKDLLFEFNFLTTPKKLMGYQSTYFEKDLIPIDINNLKKIDKKDNQLNIYKFTQGQNE